MAKRKPVQHVFYIPEIEEDLIKKIEKAGFWAMLPKHGNRRTEMTLKEAQKIDYKLLDYKTWIPADYKRFTFRFDLSVPRQEWIFGAVKDKGEVTPTSMLTLREVVLSKGDADKIPGIWKYRHNPAWKYTGSPGEFEEIEYKVRTTKHKVKVVDYRGNYTVYGPYGSYVISVKGTLDLDEGNFKDYMDKGKPTEKFFDALSEDIGWTLEEMEREGPEKAPWLDSQEELGDDYEEDEISLEATDDEVLTFLTQDKLKLYI